MTARLNEHEWELLSAYLDSSLLPEETREVEARLATDTDFQSALSSLARTRGILRAVPDVKRRRNFYLTPEMVRPRSWFWLVPVFNYSSVAAGLLAVILLAMDLLPVGMRSAPVQPAKEAASAVQMEAAPANPPLPLHSELANTPTQIAAMKEASAAPAAGIQQQAEPAPYLLDESPSDGQATGSNMPTVGTAISEEPSNLMLAPEPSQPVGAAAAPMMKLGPTGLPEGGQSEAVPPAGYAVPMERAVLEPTQSFALSAAPAEATESVDRMQEEPAAAPVFVQQPSETPLAIQTASGEIQTTSQPGLVGNALTVTLVPAVTGESFSAPDVQSPKGFKPTPTETKTRSTMRWGGWFLLLSVILGFCGTMLKKRFHV
ncbi:MAG TPA: hypothetical protein VF338_07935 [Leptolinea sp.]